MKFIKSDSCVHASLALHVYLSRTELDFDEIYAALKQTVTTNHAEIWTSVIKIQFEMLSQSYVAKTDSL